LLLCVFDTAFLSVAQSLSLADSALLEPRAPQQLSRPSRARRRTTAVPQALEALRWPLACATCPSDSESSGLAHRSRPVGCHWQCPLRVGRATTITRHVSAVQDDALSSSTAGPEPLLPRPSFRTCVNARLDHTGTGSLRRWHPGPAAAAALCRSPSLMIPLLSRRHDRLVTVIPAATP